MERKLIKSYGKKDFKIDWFSGTGAGGQYRNKHQNCCRITHLESGITTIGQNFRERPRNFKDAFTRLAGILLEKFKEEDKKERYSIPDEVVRTYHEPDNRVIDHASGLRMTYREVIDKMDIDPMITARKRAKIDG